MIKEKRRLQAQKLRVSLHRRFGLDRAAVQVSFNACRLAVEIMQPKISIRRIRDFTRPPTGVFVDQNRIIGDPVVVVSLSRPLAEKLAEPFDNEARMLTDQLGAAVTRTGRSTAMVETTIDGVYFGLADNNETKNYALYIPARMFGGGPNDPEERVLTDSKELAQALGIVKNEILAVAEERGAAAL